MSDSTLLPLHPSVLQRLFTRSKSWEKEYMQLDKQMNAQPTIGPAVAHVLRFFGPMFRADNALDLGTSLGYSAHLLSTVLQPGGHVLTVEKDSRLATEARNRFEKLGLGSRIAVIQGNALDVLEGLTGPYDLIVMDVDKQDYVQLLPLCVTVLADDGYLIVDDVGFAAKDLGASLHRLTTAAARFAKELASRKDLETVYLPIGDGITISRKKAKPQFEQLTFLASEESESGDDERDVSLPPESDQP